MSDSETIDSVSLDQMKAEELANLVVKSNFFNLPVDIPKPPRVKVQWTTHIKYQLRTNEKSILYKD
jgi:hypothetical protein